MTALAGQKVCRVIDNTHVFFPRTMAVHD
jgi:hypothetical protein